MSTVEEAKAIEIHDIKAIRHVRIPIPAGGGVVALRGRNGAGKTSAIEAVTAALSGKGSLEKHDGAAKGELEGLGVKITVGKSTRQTGELEVSSLESRLDIATLVDPGIANDDAADAKRVKALVALAGAKADPTLFHELAGGREAFEAVCQPGDTDDLLILAARVKRDLEAGARSEEAKAEHQRGQIKALGGRIAGVPLDAEADERKLRDDLESAIGAEQRMKAEAASRQKQQRDALAARDALEDAQAEYTGKSVSEAREALAFRLEGVKECAQRIMRLNAELVEAKQKLVEAEGMRENASQALQSAEAHAGMLAKWRAQIEAAEAIEQIRPEDLQTAAVAVERCRSADHLGVQVRAARIAKIQCDGAAIAAKEHAKRAEQLRQAAAGVDEVLSSLVGKLGCPLAVRHGRLVTQTGRGETLFSELSTGERWKIALDIAIEAVGPNGCLAIDGAWESLDSENRRLIAEHAKGRGPVILVTEPSDGELRAEEFAGN